jgi:phosphatidylserine synthase
VITSTQKQATRYASNRVNTENKQQYLFTTALIPMAAFIVLLAVMMVPHTNWIMFGIGLTAAFPVAVASFYGGKRFNFRSVKPHKPTLAMFPIILFAVLLILARYLNMFGFKGFMGTVLD